MDFDIAQIGITVAFFGLGFLFVCAGIKILEYDNGRRPRREDKP